MKNNYNILGNTYHMENVENIYDELSNLDFHKNLLEEINQLDEDLFQIVFNDGVIIDIGWYPSFDINGEFIIQVISAGDWENPSIKISSGWDKNDLVTKLSGILKQ